MLFRTRKGPVVRRDERYRLLSRDWDDLLNDRDLDDWLERQCESATPDESLAGETERPLAPIAGQEIWAAGVTYFRSRMARVEESRNAGGDNFYDRVYDADRPELFLKATPHRAAGPGEPMHLRRDSRWIVPEPELTLVVNASGSIVGYTIGNDLSCRDIEGENPLYLPQAKTFDRCAAVGPGILVSRSGLPPETAIRLMIRRDGRTVCEDATTLSAMKRKPQELVAYLFRDNSFPSGCLLMTGTGIVPPDDFSLRPGDIVEIAIDGIGILANPVT